MGYGATRTEPRVAASLGLLESAPIEFGAAQDVPGGGVLLAVPALLAMGLLAQRELYALPRGYYGLESLFLLLALTALARIPSLEQLRYQAPGEWGPVAGTGSHSGSADAAREVEDPVPRSRPPSRSFMPTATCACITAT